MVERCLGRRRSTAQRYRCNGYDGAASWRNRSRLSAALAMPRTRGAPPWPGNGPSAMARKRALRHGPQRGPPACQRPGTVPMRELIRCSDAACVIDATVSSDTWKRICRSAAMAGAQWVQTPSVDSLTPTACCRFIPSCLRVPRSPLISSTAPRSNGVVMESSLPSTISASCSCCAKPIRWPNL